MPIIQNRGLRGLPGLNNVSEQERQAFMLANDAKLKKFHSPRNQKRAADVLYNNQLFVRTFGRDAFDKMNDGSEDSYNLRNDMLREHAINTAFESAFKPKINNGVIDRNIGAGEYWDKLQELSLDSKEQLLKSNWMTPSEFENHHKDTGDWLDTAVTIGDAVFTAPTFLAKKIFGGDVENVLNAVDLRQNAKDMLIEGYKQYKREQNNRILDEIYNNQADNAAHDQAANVSAAYLDPKITGAFDEDTRQKFYQAITPNPAVGNMGIPEYASRWGDGTDVSSEMEDFSIDDMRQVLAKKYIYDKTMTPNMAATALNNEAKRYITAHQGSLKRLGLFANDVGIAALSYSADKINGIYNLGLKAADAIGETPIVWVDDKGNVIAPSKVFSGSNGTYTQGEDGEIHPVHQMEVDRTTLHNMGKDFDGNDDTSILNPAYWTKAEQFGTLDEEEQKQYEKIGSSPYKVSYNPNDESDLIYESFKMMSFGLADGASMFIPFGIGTVGKVLSTASKVGRVTRGLGQVMNFSGRALSAQTRFGQVAQGFAGAGGIAYAYQRGAFQEMLAQNMANAEEAALNRSRQEIFEQYQNDAQYKARIDALIDAKAASMKAEYVASLEENGTKKIVDEAKIDEMLRAKAQQEVLGEVTQQRLADLKRSPEYAALEQQAIKEAGDAAWNTFLPEAIKYGLVNTMGYRKFLYTNPQGLKKPVGKMFEKMKEVTTSDGRKRLAVDASKLMKDTDKLKNFGKVAGKQFWGGAWTNGTDDMMVDAAERMSTDSFDRYLHAFENGEALADEYGLIDGLYSYKKGLGNSLGQSTTLHAAAVGGFGSWVSTTPNMANIVHLATKEGRDAYRNNFQKRLVYETDENGYKTIKKDEDGKPVTEDVNWKENWLERAGFFVQNGVLNTYYGAKQDERALQEHADYVNGILDRYEDFNALKGLISSDIERQNAETLGDNKTMRFVHAFDAINALEQLSKDKNDALKFSSVLDDARTLIENASKIGTDESTLSEEQLAGLLSEYYAHNPGVEESDANHEIALSHIAQNAKKMMEAYDAFQDAEAQISRYERDKGITILPAVKNKMMLSRALVGHWEDRIKTMQDEIGDASSTTSKPEGDALIATYGGISNAKNRLKMYEIGMPYITSEGIPTLRLGEQPLKELLNEASARVSHTLEAYNKAQQEYRNAIDDNAKYQAEKKVKDARTAYEEALAEREFRQDELTNVQEEKKRLQEAIDAHQTGQNKVLTAEEIMALDPVSRARMLDPNESVRYTAAQIKEINKLTKDLKDRDKNGDPMQKIQDIAKLTINIAKAKDAYDRMSKNPDAAALQLERQSVKEAEKAYNIVNERNAQTLSNTAQELADGLKVNKVQKKDIDKLVYRLLRKYNNTLLDIIDKKGLLPEYHQQVLNAKEWSNVLSEIDAVISQANKPEEWKENVLKAIDRVVEPANSKEEIIANLEKAIDSDSSNSEDFEKVLSDLTALGYQRDATVLEKRKERKEREEAARAKAEAEKLKAEEEAKAAADEEAARKAEAAKTATLADVEGVPLENESPEETDGTTTEGQSKSFSIPISYTTRSGKTINTKYEVGTDEDGFTHIIYNPLIDGTDIRNHSARRKITKKILEDNGISYRDMFGESNKGGEDFDAINFEEAAIDKVTIAPDGTVAISTEAGIIGPKKGTQETAKKLLNIMFPELSQMEGEAAIPSQQTKQEGTQQNPETSVIDNVKNGHDDAIGDYVEGHSATVAEEAQQVEDMSDVEIARDTVNVDVINDEGSEKNESDPETLSGVAMPNWVINKEDANKVNEKYNNPTRYTKDLSTDHVLIPRRGNESNPDDGMNKFFAWMNSFADVEGAKGINLDNIVSDELPKILAKNPQTKIKFACVRPEDNATHDLDMVKHLLLIVDYDSNVKAAHNKDNGGVIDHEGNKYLIVGVAGWGNNIKRRGFYDVIYKGGSRSEMGLLQKGKLQYFKNHPTETFRVLEDIYTEIVPGSMIPGWIVRQGENDAPDQHRKISELLAESDRNPHKLNMNNLSWSIIEYTKALDFNTRGRDVMHPQNQDTNAGRVFVNIPAGNGKLLSAKIVPLFWADDAFDHNSELYQELNTLFAQLEAPQYKDRYEALLQLFQKLYMTPTGHNILLAKDANAITFMRDGVKVKTVFTKAPDYNPGDILKAVAEWNPRINITPSILRNPALLKKYDEAGALMTDLAKLGTAGVNYRIYPVEKDGTIIKPADTNWTPPRAQSDSEYRDVNRLEIPYIGGKSYYYDAASDTYTNDGKPVPASMRAELDYARRIIGMNPAKVAGVWNYYVLSEGEKPEVIRQNNGTNKIEEVNGEEAQKLIDEIRKRQEAAAREAAALEKLGEKMSGEATVDEETGELTVAEEDKGEEVKSIAPVRPTSQQEGMQDFNHTIRSKNRTNILNAIKDKMTKDSTWADAPVKSPKQLEDYLRRKGANVDMIPTDDAGFDAWIHDNIVCK